MDTEKRPGSDRQSLARSRLPITNRGKPAFRSLRDEALTKFGEFIGAGREFSFCDSPYTLCEAVIGMIRRSISMLLRAGSCHSIRSALCRRQRTVRYP